MPRYLSCIPAYGRDYESQKEVRADYEAGKDFLIQSMGPDNGRYINKQDTENAPENLVLNIRFKQLQNICVIKPKKTGK